MIGLDTTVLVAHEIRESPHHEEVRKGVSTHLKTGLPVFVLAPQVLQKFMHVVTDPRRFEFPLTMEEALERSARWWDAAEVVRCHPGDGTVEMAVDWIRRYRLGRKRILDTFLAAAFYEKGVVRLATINREDFQVFGVFSFESWAGSET